MWVLTNILRVCCNIHAFHHSRVNTPLYKHREKKRNRPLLIKLIKCRLQIKLIDNIIGLSNLKYRQYRLLIPTTSVPISINRLNKLARTYLILALLFSHLWVRNTLLYLLLFLGGGRGKKFPPFWKRDLKGG